MRSIDQEIYQLASLSLPLPFSIFFFRSLTLLKGIRSAGP